MPLPIIEPLWHTAPKEMPDEGIPPLWHTAPDEETDAADADDRMQINRSIGPHRKLLKKFKRSHKSGVYKGGGYRGRHQSPLIAITHGGVVVMAAINRKRPPKKPMTPARKARPVHHDFDKRSYKGWDHTHHSAAHKAHHSTAEKIRDKYHDGEKWRTQLHKHAYENHKRLVNFHKHLGRKKRGLKKASDAQMNPEEYRKRYGRSKPK